MSFSDFLHSLTKPASTEPPITDPRDHLKESSILSSKRILVPAAAIVCLVVFQALVTDTTQVTIRWVLMGYLASETFVKITTLVMNGLINIHAHKNDVEYEKLNLTKPLP